MKEEAPKSATNNWKLWKFCETITPDEIRVLITKRRNS
jgi:hypothetical protein